jgi:DNA-directed RNA polymerase subunit M/transcription elongation factor TFIIS
MALEFQCPNCDGKVLARVENVGDSTKCDNCGQLVEVPEDATSVLVEPPKVADLKNSRKSGSDSDKSIKKWRACKYFCVSGHDVILS